MANDEKGTFQIDDSNFYIVQGWMINKLGLSGNDLICFAIIYGFSQDGKSSFEGSLNYIAKFMACSRKTVVNVTSRLEASGLIIKTSGNSRDREANSYRTNIKYHDGEIIRLFPNNPPSVKITPDQCKNYTSPSVKITPQYKDVNNNSFKDEEKKDINSSNDLFISKESEDDCDKPKKRSSGVMPSKEEVEAYIAKKGYHFSADEFIRYYTCDGELEVFRFRDGRLVKDWHRCCVTFEDNWKKRGGYQADYRKAKPDDPYIEYARELEERKRKEQEERYANRKITREQIEEQHRKLVEHLNGKRGAFQNLS